MSYILAGKGGWSFFNKQIIEVNSIVHVNMRKRLWKVLDRNLDTTLTIHLKGGKKLTRRMEYYQAVTEYGRLIRYT